MLFFSSLNFSFLIVRGFLGTFGICPLFVAMSANAITWLGTMSALFALRPAGAAGASAFSLVFISFFAFAIIVEVLGAALHVAV